MTEPENNTSKPKEKLGDMSTLTKEQLENMTVEIPALKKKGRGRPRKSKSDSEEETEEEIEKTPLAPTQLWYNDESGDFFDQLANKKSWMSGFDSVAGALKDGKTYTRDTKMHGDECYKDPYFNMFVAGVETIPESFNPNSFRVGFYNNQIFVHARNASERPKRVQISKEVEEMQDYVTKVAEAIYNFNHPMQLIFAVSTDPKKNASKLLKDYKDKKLAESETELKANPTMINRLRDGYFGNLENIVERVSAIYAIARYFAEVDDKSIDRLKKMPNSTLVICYQDVEKAISFYDRVVIRGLNEVLRLMAKAERKQTLLESYEKIFSEIKDYLKNSVVEASFGTIKCAMTYQKLFEKMPSNYKRFAEYIDSAVEAGIVHVHTGVPLQIGAPSRVVQLQSQYILDNPPQQTQSLTDETIAKLNAEAKLSPEEQAKKAEDVFKELCKSEE
jgi:hypothetical protein